MQNSLAISASDPEGWLSDGCHKRFGTRIMYKLFTRRYWQLGFIVGTGWREKVEDVFSSCSGPYGGLQPAPRCVLRKLALSQQLLKNADKPLSGKDWEMDIFVCSFCVDPWTDSQLKTASLFATIIYQYIPSTNDLYMYIIYKYISFIHICVCK